MNGRIVMAVLLVLVLVALIAGVGIYTYNAGIAQGMVTSGKITVPEQGAVPYPYYGPFFYRPFGFGFGLFGCLVPLLFFFVIFGLFRAIFWGGPWGWRRRHYWGQGVPPGFEEWHRQAHEPQSSAPTNK